MRKKKNKKGEKFKIFIIGYLTACVLILGMTLLLDYFDNGKILSSNPEIPKEVSQIVNKCSNLPIDESAECANKIVKSFYIYNISNLGKDLEFNELQKEGGVCSHWAKLYCMIGEELGFYTYYNDKITLGYENYTINNKTSEYMTKHANCIWSNQEAYVILDQQSVFVFKFA